MTPEEALVDVTARLTRLGVSHALVGGLAVSIRAEVRFTRDVDLAISVDSDADLERITRTLAAEGFALIAVVEQEDRERIAIARLRSPSGIVIDLLAASSGIEREIVGAARETPELPWSPGDRAGRPVGGAPAPRADRGPRLRSRTGSEREARRPPRRGHRLTTVGGGTSHLPACRKLG